MKKNYQLDKKTNEFEKYIINEEKPNLIVYTGDCVDCILFNCLVRGWDNIEKDYYKSMWNLWTQPSNETKIPYAYVLGNHDAGVDLSGDEIMKLDMTNSYSMSQYSENLTGASNISFFK